MTYSVFSELEYEVLVPTSFIFNLHVAKTRFQTILEESIDISPNMEMSEFSSVDKESIFTKLHIGQKSNFKISYRAIVEYTYLDQSNLLENFSRPVNFINLDLEVLQYLYPSRYCQSDKLEKLASKEFGYIANEYEKVQAITQWIYNNVEYRMGSTNSNTSAIDTLSERVGVCRDFAHLAIAICRAASIPARYFTCYAHNLISPDFHACFEAYISGQWVLFDPTKLVPIEGLIKISSGRDAADASVATILGEANCTSLKVECTIISS
jgi:transglutaminase-like putative cysteine protease